jgi:hypothetical protein
MSVYSGYVTVNGVRVQVDFEAKSSASKHEVDSAFVAQLEKVVELNYLVIGEYEIGKETENVCKT